MRLGKKARQKKLQQMREAKEAEMAAERERHRSQGGMMMGGMGFGGGGGDGLLNAGELRACCDAYTHRVGRTARAGASGTALTLVSTAREDGEVEALRAIQRDQPPLPALGGESGFSVSSL